MNPRKEICSLASPSANVYDVLKLIEQLERLTPDGTITDVEMQMAGDVGAATLFEETLTDGSKVYCIQLR